MLASVKLRRQRLGADSSDSGTSFNAIVAELASSGIPVILHTTNIPTTTPTETLTKCVTAMKAAVGQGRRFKALGVASFGPVDLNEKSATYGCITTTPKVKWQNADILGMLKALLKEHGVADDSLVTAMDTDVNAAALAMASHFSRDEQRALENLAYVTVGTGIGVGIFSHNRLLHGVSHPEAGHI